MRHGKNAYDRIREGMRRNEQELLDHLRTTDRHIMYGGLGDAWMKALDRLQAAGMVRYSAKRYRYVVRKHARPVTPLAR